MEMSIGSLYISGLIGRKESIKINRGKSINRKWKWNVLSGVAMTLETGVFSGMM